MSLNIIYKCHIIGIESQSSSTESNIILPSHTDTPPQSLKISTSTVGKYNHVSSAVSYNDMCGMLVYVSNNCNTE